MFSRYLAGAQSNCEKRLSFLHTTPSACLLNIHMKQRGSHWTDFSEILRWGFFINICMSNSSLSDKNNKTFWLKT